MSRKCYAYLQTANVTFISYVTLQCFHKRDQSHMAQIMSISSADELRQVFSSAATTQKVNFNFKTRFKGFAEGGCVSWCFAAGTDL